VADGRFLGDGQTGSALGGADSTRFKMGI